MKKCTGKILALLMTLVLVIGLLPIGSVFATGTPQVWTDDFSSGKGSAYTPHGYWWNLDGVLTVGDANAGAGVCYYWLNDYVWDDFIMEFDVINQTAEFGVIFRAQRTTAVDCQNQGYGVLSDTNWAFFMAENGMFSNLDALISQGNASMVDGYNTAAQPGTSNVHWKIVAKGERIEVYFNHAATPNMVMDATLYQSGAVGFRTNNPGGKVTAVVDNLRIQSMDETTPPEEPTPPEVSKIEAFDISWVPYGGSWALIDGGLNIAGDSATVWPKLISDSDYQHFTIEADLVGVRSGGIVFRSNDPAVGADAFNGYYVGYDSNYAFFGKDDGGWSTINTGGADAIGTTPLAYKERMHWKLEVSGNTFTLYVDDMETPLIQNYDNTFTAAGGVGFRVFATDGLAAGRFENVVITPIADEDAKYTTEGTYELWAKRLIKQYPAEDNQGKIILIGHSHMEFWRECHEDLAPYEILNFGMGGSRVDHIAGRNDTMLIPYAPKAVIVCTGGNDVAQGRDAATVTAATKAYLESVRTDLPGVPIIFFNNWMSPVVQDSSYKVNTYNEINGQIKQWCQSQEDVYYFDCSSVVHAGDSEIWLSDRIHMNATGYDKLTEIFKPYLEAVLNGTLEPEETEPPTEPPTEPAQSWTDDFSSDKGGFYTPHGYWWNMDGKLSAGDPNAGAGVCYYWLKDMVWDDFVMEFDVLQQSSEFGVILRAQNMTAEDCQNYGYGVLYDTDWAFFMAENGGFNTFDDLKAQGKARAVSNYPTACQPSGTRNVHWKIVASGNKIYVYFDYAKTPSMVMSASMWESGYIGFRTNNPGGEVTAVVDNLTITELKQPYTGDDTPVELFLFLGTVSLAALAVIAIIPKRKKAIQ